MNFRFPVRATELGGTEHVSVCGRYMIYESPSKDNASQDNATFFSTFYRERGQWIPLLKVKSMELALKTVEGYSKGHVTPPRTPRYSYCRKLGVRPNDIEPPRF